MSIYTFHDILNATDKNSLSRGKIYARQNRVKYFFLSKSGSQFLIDGKVIGSRLYHQTIRIHRTKTRAKIMGECSCPVEFNCKHVVALLLHGLEKQSEVLAKSHPVKSELGEELNAWLKNIGEAFKNVEENNKYPDDILQRLVYVINPEIISTSQAGVRVTLYSVRLRVNGEFSKAKPKHFNINNFFFGQPAHYLRPIDLEIISALRINNQVFSMNLNVQSLQGKTGSQIFSKIVSTGRCYWKDIHSPAMKSGPNIKGDLFWKTKENGDQKPAVSFPNVKNFETFVLDPLHYYNLKTGETGEIQTNASASLASAFMKAPSIKPEQVDPLIKKITKQFPTGEIPKPAILKTEIIKTNAPIPCLKFFMGEIDQPISYDSFGFMELPMVWLSFEYDEMTLPWNNLENALQTLPNKSKDTLIKIKRHLEVEEAARDKLIDLDFVQYEELYLLEQDSPFNAAFVYFPEEFETHEKSFINLFLDEIPQLEKEGWKIDLGEFPFQIQKAEDIFIEIEDNNENDWFEIDAYTTIDENRINLLPLLVDYLDILETTEPSKLSQCLKEEKTLFLINDEGGNIAVNAKKVEPLLQFLLALLNTGEIKEKKARLSRYRSAELSDLEDRCENIQWSGGETIRDLGRQLNKFEGIEPVKAPKEFTGQLRSYQQEGLNWLQFLRKFNLNGILADDMGLGKTIQALVHINVEKSKKRITKPCLVIMPTSLIPNWIKEALQFAPNLSVLSLHGPNRKSFFKDIDKHDLVLTTYPLLSRDKSFFMGQKFHAIILDEAQAIKNSNSQVAQVAYQLNADHRLCLTGTPMENHLGELWSIMTFLMPGLLGDEKHFSKAFRTPIEKQNDQNRRELLTKRIKPFILRRTKEQVATELPKKQVMVELIPFAKEQKTLYEAVRLSMNNKVRAEISKNGFGRSHIIILEALLKLRQVCCDPRLVKMEKVTQATASAKLDRLMEMLPEMIEENRKVLIFSQFTSMLSLIEKELNLRSINFVKLTGQTKNRKTPVEHFQSGQVPIFLISLKAGGTGLNLTTADTVIHYDPWWNPAIEEQATDRAHRIGQNKKVFVYKLLAENSVEEKILKLQEKKKALTQGFLESQDGSNSAITEEDLQNLFEPLPN